jgi:proline iminopeptidase
MSSTYWQPLVGILQSHYRCLLYDERGFGRSQPLPSDCGVDIDEHAEDLHALITQLRLKEVTLIGHGLGCWIGLICARRHPQDVHRLVLVAPPTDNSETNIQSLTHTPMATEPPISLPSLWQQASLILKDLATVPMLRNLVVWRYRQAPEPFRTRLYEDFALADRRAAFHLLASTIGEDNRQRLLQMLVEITAPVLLMRGADDDSATADTLRLLFDTIGQGKMATIRDCGHFPMLDYTADFARLLENFLGT